MITENVRGYETTTSQPHRYLFVSPRLCLAEAAACRPRLSGWRGFSTCIRRRETAAARWSWSLRHVIAVAVSRLAVSFHCVPHAEAWGYVLCSLRERIAEMSFIAPTSPQRELCGFQRVLRSAEVNGNIWRTKDPAGTTFRRPLNSRPFLSPTTLLPRPDNFTACRQIPEK